MSFTTVFLPYEDDGRAIMKMQQNLVYVETIFAFSRNRIRTASLVDEGITHCTNGAPGQLHEGRLHNRHSVKPFQFLPVWNGVMIASKFSYMYSGLLDLVENFIVNTPFSVVE